MKSFGPSGSSFWHIFVLLEDSRGPRPDLHQSTMSSYTLSPNGGAGAGAGRSLCREYFK